MPKQLKNCAACGQWCEKPELNGFFSIPFPLHFFGISTFSPAFCCPNCRNLYDSARPIRRLIRKISIVWNTVVYGVPIVACVLTVVAQSDSRHQAQTTANISSTGNLVINKDEVAATSPKGEILKWVSNDGKVIEAEFRGLQGDDVLLKVASTGETHIVPLARLSAESQLQAKAAKK